MFFTISPEPSTHIKVWLGILIAIAVWAIFADFWVYFKTRPKSFSPNSEQITEYLCKFLGSGGRAAVFSRDLSWAASNSVGAKKAADILIDKSKCGELSAFVGNRNGFVDTLLQNNAVIHNYSSLGFTPASRFTIIDYGKAGSRLAIGLVDNGKHVIHEFGSSDLAVMALACDLVELAERASERLK